MKVYAPGDYGDDYVYVNIFLWDNKWGVPKFNGEEMTRISFEKAYDHAYKEMYDFYKANNTTLSAHSDYKEQTKYIHAIFRSKSTVSESGSGTVSVTDRFGNNYSSTISW